MVREKFLKQINDTIDENPKFSFADFTVEQKSSNIRGIKTTVIVQYDFDEKYYLKINIPSERTVFNQDSYKEALDYHIVCEYSPGDIELNEKIKVRGTDGVLSHISYWLNLVWDELMAIPVNREFKSLKKSVEELFVEIEKASNEPFSQSERNDFEEKLNKLEKRFADNLKSQELEKEELENKLEILHTEIDGLKKTLKVFNKKNWLKSFGAKVLSWGAKPENQKIISDGAKIVKGFIGNSETNG